MGVKIKKLLPCLVAVWLFSGLTALAGGTGVTGTLEGVVVGNSSVSISVVPEANSRFHFGSFALEAFDACPRIFILFEKKPKGFSVFGGSDDVEVAINESMIGFDVRLSFIAEYDFGIELRDGCSIYAELANGVFEVAEKQLIIVKLDFPHSK